jgi:Protein of unknown function (DUF2892)
LSIAKTALYTKNVPNWERALRVVLSGVTIAAALANLPAPWNWVVAASALGFALTGLVGFCPACALVGRRLEKR